MDVQESELRALEAFMNDRLERLIAIVDFMKDSVCLAFEDRQDLRKAYLHGLFLRALGWVMSQRKLDEGSDFQAVVGCSRALLEIACDMVLVSKDQTDTSAFRMRQWEVSAKLNVARPIIEYYKRRIRKRLPDEFEPLVDFMDKEEKSIEQHRIDLWPKTDKKPDHPNRWTGHNRTLVDDVRKADDLYGSEIRKHLGNTLEAIYETQYREMNLYIHGSGLVGLWNLPPKFYYSKCASTHDLSSRLALFCTRIVLDTFNFDGKAEVLLKEWERIKE